MDNLIVSYDTEKVPLKLPELKPMASVMLQQNSEVMGSNIVEATRIFQVYTSDNFSSFENIFLDPLRAP